MMQTYLTFARLFQGTVKIEHLKGPVGIAHIGTRLADRGMIWLLFFMALISINLAVINFLPLPIVDGGQFIFLLIEQVRGRPVPIQVQNAATIAGLVLIGSLFLIVTFNDIMGLFGR
jgi:regulator of sigma E protease